MTCTPAYSMKQNQTKNNQIQSKSNHFPGLLCDYFGNWTQLNSNLLVSSIARLSQTQKIQFWSKKEVQANSDKQQVQSSLLFLQKFKGR